MSILVRHSGIKILSLLLVVILEFSFVGIAQALVNDRQITIQSATDVVTRRQALIQFIWGSDGFPSDKLPSSVDLNVSSPVRNLNNLERVDTLHIALDPGDSGLAHHFIPQLKNNRLIILHHGHACNFDDQGSFGLQPTINALLSNRFSVLAVYMPHERPGDCGTIGHDTMFSTISIPPGHGSVMKFFLEATAASLNYLKTQSTIDSFPVYRDFNMVGLSGGGWTTTVYAAIDPRIRLSFPVAGSIPLYLRSDGSIGDEEQTHASFYQIAGYPDLYVLGSFGGGRKQVQILNRFDDCCFGQAQHSVAQTGMTYDQAMRNYESQIQTVLTTLGAGFFRLEIDDVAPRHMISQHAVNIILSELDHPFLTLDPPMAASRVGDDQDEEQHDDHGHTVTAALTDSNGAPIPDVTVTFEVSGANPQGLSKDETDENGQVSFTYQEENPGIDIITATANVQGETLTSTATMIWVDVVSLRE